MGLGLQGGLGAAAAGKGEAAGEKQEAEKKKTLPAKLDAGFGGWEKNTKVGVGGDYCPPFVVLLVMLLLPSPPLLPLLPQQLLYLWCSSGVGRGVGVGRAWPLLLTH